MDLVKIVPVVKKYKWGDELFIPSLLGYPPNGEPHAELWFATHPGGEATLSKGTPLSSFLKELGTSFLGERVVEGWGRDLPFLLKVLSIAEPLSLQVHPSTAQAQAGWDKEAPLREKGVDEELNYRDPRQKEEVICALTPMTALFGFLPIETIRENFNLLFSSMLEESLFSSTEHFFKTLYTFEDSFKEELLQTYRNYIEERGGYEEGEWLTREGVAKQCLELYPHDIGSLAPYFMEVLHLEVGEALYLAPGTLHAYVKGAGVELMSNSDNVLRGGLTPKRVDLAELLSLLNFNSGGSEKAPRVYDSSGCLNIMTPASDFMLGLFEKGDYAVEREAVIELLFCSEGEVLLTYPKGEVKIARGECLIVSASLTTYHLEVEGTLFRATLPPLKEF